MENHFLCSFGKTVAQVNIPKTFYDFHSQQSYIDPDYTDKVIKHLNSQSTIETCVIENSDPDEFHMKGPRSGITETIESTDADEFHMYGPSSTITKTLEESDIDEFHATWSLGTRETRTIETSDPDELLQ